MIDITKLRKLSIVMSIAKDVISLLIIDKQAKDYSNKDYSKPQQQIGRKF